MNIPESGDAQQCARLSNSHIAHSQRMCGKGPIFLEVKNYHCSCSCRDLFITLELKIIYKIHPECCVQRVYSLKMTMMVSMLQLHASAPMSKTGVN